MGYQSVRNTLPSQVHDFGFLPDRVLERCGFIVNGDRPAATVPVRRRSPQIHITGITKPLLGGTPGALPSYAGRMTKTFIVS